MSVFDSAIDLNDVPKSSWKEYIGPGYRNVCYRTGHDRKGQIVLFGFDREGNRKTFICPHKSHVHYRVGYKTDLKDIFGYNLATMEFDSSFDRKKYLERMEGMFVVEALRPEQEFLQEMFVGDYLDETFNTQKRRIFYLDIENEISESFMSPKDALNRINMITLYDTETEKYYTWSLLHADINFHDETDENGNVVWENPLKKMPKDKFVFKEFNNDERALLDDFLLFWENNYPDVLATYNGRAYDLPYIVRRIENVLGEEDAKRLSPVGRYRKKEPNLDNERENKEADLYIDVEGLSQSDILILYRDKFNLAPALDGGYGLSNVGEHEELGTKVQYSGTLKDLYIQDYQKFYEYNVRDVDLLYRIDLKRRLTDLARGMTSMGLCGFDTIYSSIPYLTGSLVAFSRSVMGGMVFVSYRNEDKKAIKFEGAFVFEPIPGLYKGVMCVDVNSLYPNSIVSGNISPETYVGKVSLKPIAARTVHEIIAFNSEEPIDLSTCDADVFYVLQANGQQKKLSRSDLYALLTRCIFTRNNTLFLKHSVKWGVVPKWCEYYYGMRKSTKKKKEGIELDIYNKKIVDDVEVHNAKIQIGRLDSRQMALKYAINSIYGCMGNSYFSLSSPYIAQSITRTGKFANQSTAKYIASELKRRYNVPEKYITTISGDTDSVIFSSRIWIKGNDKRSVEIGRLFNDLLSEGYTIENHNGYELIDCEGLEILTNDGKFVPLKYLSRHKTPKHLVRLSIYQEKRNLEVTVTTDHVCMVYDKDHFMESKAACWLRAGDMVSVYDPERKIEVIGNIEKVEDIGQTDDYVYDAEVDDPSHTFYANDILVHNSQFVHVECVTDQMIREKGLSRDIVSWSDDDKLELWRTLSDFVDNGINVFVQNLIRDTYGSEQTKNLRYGLEYIGDIGIYEAKKRYAVRKILSEGPEIVDKIKYSGLELKRSNVSPKIKEFLGEIYKNTLTKGWTERDFKEYLNRAYEDFLKLDITDVAFWKGFNTARDCVSFLKMQKGSTAIASACTFYNQLLDKMKLGRKYDHIRVGNKIRFSYINPQNRFGIKYIAFPDGQYPEEFRDVFKLDQDTMFDKVILSPLKGYMNATGFRNSDPRKQPLGEIDDI